MLCGGESPGWRKLPVCLPLPLLTHMEALVLAALEEQVPSLLHDHNLAAPQPPWYEVFIQHRASTGDQEGKKG